jgi:hypothetical protein
MNTLPPALCLLPGLLVIGNPCHSRLQHARGSGEPFQGCIVWSSWQSRESEPLAHIRSGGQKQPSCTKVSEWIYVMEPWQATICCWSGRHRIASAVSSDFYARNIHLMQAKFGRAKQLQVNPFFCRSLSGETCSVGCCPFAKRIEVVRGPTLGL